MSDGGIARSVTRGAFYLALEKAVALLSGVLYFALLLRWLGPTKYGIITLALSFVALASLLTGNLEVYLERYAAEHEARGRLHTLRRAYRLALGIKLGLGALAAALLVGLAIPLGRAFEMPELTSLLLLLSPILLCDGLFTTGRAMLYGWQRFRWLSLLSIGFHLGKTALVGALWGVRQGLPELAIGLSALTIVNGLAFTALPMWMLRHARDERPGSDDPGGIMRQMLRYTLPLLGARLANVSAPNVSKVLLGKLLDIAQLGYFSFAFQTVERFCELAMTLPSALLPPLTQLVARGETHRLRAVFDRTFRIIQSAAAGLVFGVFVFAPELTLWVGSPLFEPAIPLLRIMALVPFVRTAQQPVAMLFQALRRPQVVLGLAVVKLAVELAGYLALVPALGLTGAGWAHLGGVTAAFVAALAMLAFALPGSAGTEARGTGRTLVWLAPFLTAALMIDGALAPPAAFLAKLVLVPVALVGAFALGLVTRDDLDRAAAMQVRAGWMSRARDTAVAAGARIANAVALRRAS